MPDNSPSFDEAEPLPLESYNIYNRSFRTPPAIPGAQNRVGAQTRNELGNQTPFSFLKCFQERLRHARPAAAGIVPFT